MVGEAALEQLTVFAMSSSAPNALLQKVQAESCRGLYTSASGMAFQFLLAKLAWLNSSAAEPSLAHSYWAR